MKVIILSGKRKIVVLAILIITSILIGAIIISLMARNQIDHNQVVVKAVNVFDIFPPKLTEAELKFVIPEFKAKATMTNKSWLAELQQLIEISQEKAGSITPREAFWQLSLKYDNGEEQRLLLSRELKIYHPEKQVWIEHQDLSWQLNSLTVSLEQKFFGEPVSWTEVDNLFPRKTKATVRDLETGLTFQIFRYGGTFHVDVEPLSLEDMTILNLIYQGEWSWKRRAVVVSAGGRQIAASMNGMPHGNGDIGDNQFKGHFCIHFAGSQVHKTSRVDQGHQLMVNKASGLIWDNLQKANPEEFAATVLAAVANGDSATIRYAAGELEPLDLWSQLAGEIRFLQVENINVIETGELDAQVEVKLTVYYYQPNKDKGYKKSLVFDVHRLDPDSGWLIALPQLAPLVERVPEEEIDQVINLIEPLC